MKKAIWIKKGTSLELVIEGDGSYLEPTAKEIYAAEFKNNTVIRDMEVSQPSRTDLNIGFSKYPINLFIKINIKKEMPVTLSTYNCQVVGKIDDIEVVIPNPISRFIDHIIINDKWYPFLKGSLEDIQDILKSLNIDDNGKLSLRQYFGLINKKLDIIFNYVNDQPQGLVDIVQQDNDYSIPGFVGQLYPYQQKGYAWLRMIDKEDFGCILADEMGLGKTIQIICLLTKNISENKRPSLIVSPATLLENWKREFLKFAPNVKTLIHSGQGRTGLYIDLLQYDIIITSYDTVIRDLSMLRMIKWDVVILDEAQSIKNPIAMRTKDVKQIPRRVAIAVTGTPIENRLVDLWSILDYAIPGFLGSLNEFEKRFENTVESASAIEPIISPVVLRRTINMVANDLPERIDIPQPIEMPEEMVNEYEKIRIDTLKEYKGIAALTTLLRLRMYCTHPYLINGNTDNPDIISPKYRRLVEIVEEIVDNNEKILIFTSFTKMIDLLLYDIQNRFNVYTNFIDGRTPVKERQSIVDKFSKITGPAVLILNPKAAGTGLNLYAANHVIHYNLEWNPAVEDQASARAYRRGQDKPVTIHRLYFVDSIEEVINERLQRKRELSKSAVIGITGDDADYLDLMNALEITPFREK